MDRSKEKIMTIFAHQDDETFSAGGVLAKYGEYGNSYAVSVTFDERREKEFLDACAILKTNPIQLPFPKITPNNEGEIRESLMDIILKVKPSHVITHVSFDYHHEHRYVRKIVEEVVEWVSHTTSARGAHQIEYLWEAETTILLPFPEYYIDITEYNEQRLRAIKVYESQAHKGGDDFYSKFHNTRTQLRGIQSGVEHAEAFNLVKISKTGAFKPVKHLKYFP